ncbi:hypothetical protein H0H87_005315 [Tephrocybe sp. NHM501043]|nr:hypothetical protein H0H87_005315 [Tephrocybe sp. NHM501043]
MPFQNVKLNDGNEIPAIAFGSGSALYGKDAADYVVQAIEAGFSHLDTAQVYKNEESVGVAIRESGLSRDELFVTTKYWSGPIQQSARESLSKLGLKYVDLYLIHQPYLIAHDFERSWKELEQIKEDGLAKSIGVSNFNLEQLQTIVKSARIKPAVNQIQFHPYNYAQHKSLLEYSAKHGIVTEAYGSLAPLTKFPGGPVEEPVNAAAKRLGITPNQVIFAWVKAKGVVIVTTSSKKSRLEEYLAVGDLSSLTKDEIAAIDQAGAKGHPLSRNARDIAIATIPATLLFATLYLLTNVEMLDQKPLPALPVPAALALDARQHRSQLIRNFLSEIHDPSIQSKRDGWLYVLEGALDELGRALNQGRWIEGVRKMREQQREERTREAEHELKRQERLKANKRSKAQDEQAESESSSMELPPLPVAFPATGVKHLFLCMAPPGNRVPLPFEDSGFDIVPSTIGCSFKAGTYALQDAETPTILFSSKGGCGPHMDLIRSNASKDGNATQMVGGTFTFKGVTSPQQHEHLFRVLRLAIYIHLSLTLEQHLFVDSKITLTFPRPRLPPSYPSVPGRSTPPSTMDNKPKKTTPSSLFPSSLRSFFPFKSTSMSRSTTITPLSRETSGSTPHSRHSPRTSFDFGANFRFSLLGGASIKSPTTVPQATVPDPHPHLPFTQALARLQAGAELLSTSPGVRFEPPALIVELAEREKQNGTRRLRGDERAGLASVLGWDSSAREQASCTSGMLGSIGFVRQQCLEVLVSHHVPGAPDYDPTVDGTIRTAVCGRAKWRMFRYYAGEEDVSLGDMVMNLVEAAGWPCEVTGCKFVQGLHETRMIHDGVKVTINVEERKGEDSPINQGKVKVWESCGNCGTQSRRHEMSDGTYLLSFGKFLELLVYSNAFGVPTYAICTHTERLGLHRHFSTSSHTVSFTCSRVDDIFQLRVPRLQISRSERTIHDSASSLIRSESVETAEESEEEQEKRELRREIRRWWEGVADHMDKLEAIFADYDGSENFKSKGKALPRLPSTDDDYTGLVSEPTSTGSVTTSISGLPVSPSTPPRQTSRLPDPSSLELTPGAPAPPPSSPAPPTNPPVEETETQTPVVRLYSLRQTFHRTEQSLYAQLSRTHGATLNDVRRSFVAAAQGAEKRLRAWQKKHLGDIGKDKKAKDKEGSVVENTDCRWAGSEEPMWWKIGCHVLPGSNVIVEEEDWGSVIAFTLSTADYQGELSHISSTRQISTTPPHTIPHPPNMDASPTLSNQSNHSSFFSAAMNYKLFTSSANPQPDPDLDDVTWSVPELFSAVVSRKEHPRDPSSLLSIREVLRTQQKSPAPESSRFGSLGRGPAPPSAWAKPDVQVSKDEADGVVSASSEGSEAQAAGKLLQEFESTASGEASFRPVSRASVRAPSSLSMTVEPVVRNGSGTSVASSVESDATIGKETLKEPPTSNGVNSEANMNMPPPPPPKDEDNNPREQDIKMREVSGTTTASSFASTLTTGLNHAMRFVLRDTVVSTEDNIRVGSPSLKAHHGLLSIDAAGIDERPHIKYDWTIGKRLKFSCTVYYAKQFDLLRRRCGVDDVFIKSLQHSTNWAADGGKSRSNFWKTTDDRFIIKTLVDAWNVADLQVLIDLAPSYFRYMDATVNKATVLAKMMGFYTIEIRNLETGIVQSKADLVVMENLFYDQTVAKTFDLKGIQGRKVKPSTGIKVAPKSKTLFDGEWIEGQQKALMLVRPHSKQVLRSAIRSDADFLAKSNIMDYSLLVGVDEEHKQISCGLVDTIGSYTFAKTLEYKAKHGLNSGKEITVIPPAEYQERFVSALEGYFLACPDKWSKPSDERKVMNDTSLLPSVL